MAQLDFIPHDKLREIVNERDELRTENTRLKSLLRKAETGILYFSSGLCSCTATKQCMNCQAEVLAAKIKETLEEK